MPQPGLLGQTSNRPWFAKACRTLALRHIRTRPYTPRSNGKAARFIQTLCKECAYAMLFQISEERNRWLPRYLAIDNRLKEALGLGLAITSAAAC